MQYLFKIYICHLLITNKAGFIQNFMLSYKESKYNAKIIKWRYSSYVNTFFPIAKWLVYTSLK